MIGIAPVVKAVVVESATILRPRNVVIKVRAIRALLNLKTSMNAAMVPLKAEAHVVTLIFVEAAPIVKRLAGGATSAAATHASGVVTGLVTI